MLYEGNTFRMFIQGFTKAQQCKQNFGLFRGEFQRAPLRFCYWRTL